MTTVSKSCVICEVEFTPRTSRQKTCGLHKCQMALKVQRDAQWQKDNPGKARAASSRYRAKPDAKVQPWPAKRALGLEITELKATTPCTDCGQIFPEECMDFDHVRGEKISNVGTMVSHGWNRDRVFDEINKCELVCANCHRTRTKKRRLGLL